jgi:VanZ family protein
MFPAPSHFYFLSRPARGGWQSLLWAWLPVLFFLIALGVESSALLGSDRTSAPLHTLAHAISGARGDGYWPLIHHLIRKTGHFLGYGFFSLAVLRGLKHGLTLVEHPSADWAELTWQLHFVAVAAIFIVAALDELHQSFVPNRTGKFADVLLDTAGAVLLQLLLRIFLLGREWLQTRNEVRMQPEICAISAETVAA